MEIIRNQHRHEGIDTAILRDIPFPSTNSTQVKELLSRCPSSAVTPLVNAKQMAREQFVGQISIKDERQRMGLGSFKALGAAYVIAYRAMIEGESQVGKTYVTSSAGNHGLSVAAGAKAFGANSVIYISSTVPEAFVKRLMAEGAKVIRAGQVYEESMEAAKRAAEDNGWVLLSDTSWPEYYKPSYRLMEGYTVLMDEASAQIDTPTHIFLQAGVGGLAGATAAMVRKIWGQDVIIIVVEPSNAPALHSCIQAGDFVFANGSGSSMGRLDCQEASLIALKGLARDANFFALISEDEGDASATYAALHNMVSTSSGASGLAGLISSAPHRNTLGLNENSHVMIIMSEGPE